MQFHEVHKQLWCGTGGEAARRVQGRVSSGLSAWSCQPLGGAAFLLLFTVFWEESVCSLSTSLLLSECQGIPKKSSASSDADCFEEPNERFFKALYKVGQVPREEHGEEQWLNFYGQKELENWSLEGSLGPAVRRAPLQQEISRQPSNLQKKRVNGASIKQLLVMLLRGQASRLLREHSEILLHRTGPSCFSDHNKIYVTISPPCPQVTTKQRLLWTCFSQSFNKELLRVR